MKASELLDILNKLQQTTDLCQLDIVVMVEEDWVGPTPSVGVSSVSSGFDWDSDRLLLEPARKLKVSDTQEREVSVVDTSEVV